jgi:hypothetical protein
MKTEEPPIEAQIGGAQSADELERPRIAAKRRHERPSLFNVKFKELQGFEFWITAFNRIFLVDAKTGEAGHPILRMTGDVMFDPPLSGVPEAVVAALSELLEKQRKVRSKMVKEEEYDNTAWDWS